MLRGRIRFARKYLPIYLLLLLFPVLLLYSTLIEPRWVGITRVPIALERLPVAFHGMTVVQLSDLHYPANPGPAYFRRVIKMTNDLHPDMIVLTGDYVPRSKRDIGACAALLSELHAPLGVYAVLGNHDYWVDGAEEICQSFTRAGITVLKNRAMPISRSGARIWVVGLDDYWVGSANSDRALLNTPASEAKILLVHEPDYASTAAMLPVDLQLSGHSHGGQFRLPVIGGILYPSQGERYSMGWYRVGKLQVYTNRGIGAIVPLRFNCRPEITMFTLKCPSRTP